VQLWPVEDGVVVHAQALTLIDAGTGAARRNAAGVDPVPTGLASAAVGGTLVVPRNRGVDAVDLATGAAASSADTDVLSVSAAALVARRGERVTVLAPG
jgi:hypothetical protein